MDSSGVLLLVTLGIGPVMALGAICLGSATVAGRRAYAGAVAAQLLLLAALTAVVVIPRADGDGALPWLVALIAAPLAVAAIIGLAIRDERSRGGQGWVPTSVLAAFPAFIFIGVVLLLSSAS